MPKAIWIDNTLHDRVKTYAFARRTTIGALTESLWVEHLNNAVAPSNEAAQTTIIIEKRSPGRVAGKKWRMPDCEKRAMALGNAVPSRVVQADIGQTALKWRIDENMLIPENPQTSIIMDCAGNGNGIPASEYLALESLNNIRNLVEVSDSEEPFTPRNELAEKILALMPGREDFSRYLLFILSKAGFSIKYVDFEAE